MATIHCCECGLFKSTEEGIVDLRVHCSTHITSTMDGFLLISEQLFGSPVVDKEKKYTCMRIYISKVEGSHHLCFGGDVLGACGARNCNRKPPVHCCIFKACKGSVAYHIREEESIGLWVVEQSRCLQSSCQTRRGACQHEKKEEDP